MSHSTDQPEETFEISEPLDERGRDLWAAAQALSEEARHSEVRADYEPLAPPSQDYYYDNSTNTQDLTDALRLAAEEGSIGSDLWERAMAMSHEEARRASERPTTPPRVPEPAPEPQQEYTVPEPEPAHTVPAKELEPFDHKQARARVRQQQEEVRAARAAQRQQVGFPPPPTDGGEEDQADAPKRPAPRPQSLRGKSMADKLRPPQEDEKPLTPRERKKRAKAQAKKAKEDAKAAEQAKKAAAKAAKKEKKPKARKKAKTQEAAQASEQGRARRSSASEKLPPLNRDGQATSSFSAVQDPPQADPNPHKASKGRPKSTAEQMNSLSAADVGRENGAEKPVLTKRAATAFGRSRSLSMGRPPEVDLLPLELQDAKRTRAVQSAAALFVLIVFVVMVGLTLIAWQDARTAQAEQQAAEQLSTDLTAAQAQFQEARELADTVEALGAAADAATFTHISWFDIMADLRRSIPSEVRIEGLQIDSASPLEPYVQRQGPYDEGSRAGYIEFAALTADLPDLAVWTRGLDDVPGFTEATVVQMEGDDDEGYEVLMQVQLQESLFTVPEVAE
ncbi:hypothetical protein [Nesterenkonia populi]|uniref:hypothetical protein n=1 Tax=Nesterenkonia populi TaxID=1591087 RepID=UPI0011BE5230|nr:hypothetical protein [Nesterenkonia populi]